MERIFPLIEIQGQPFDMGYQHGAQLRKEIAVAFETFRDVLTNDPFGSFPSTWVKPSFQQVVDMAGRSVPFAEEFVPELVTEMRGVAEGSGLTFEEIFALNSWADAIITLNVQARKGADAGGCSGFAVGGRATADGETYVGWNGDDSEWWLESSVLLKGKPAGGLPFLLWTTAGWVGRPGLNPYLALSANSLFPSDCSPGVPYPLVCRKILQQTSVEDAVSVIAGMKRVAGMNYTIGDVAGDVAAVETTARRIAVITGVNNKVVHTNHYTADELLCYETRRDQPYLLNTQARLARVQELLMEPAARPITLDSLKVVLSDHASYPFPICRHGGEEQGGAMTLTSLICLPGRSKMLVSYGPPCEQGYVEYAL